MILAWESSCDESALALFDPAQGLRGEWVYSQVALHQRYGGVVPELASREHLERFGPLLRTAMAETDFSDVREVAVTCGPGLAGCLALGMAGAKAFALSRGLPLRGVNHLRGHVFSPFIALHAEEPGGFEERLQELCPHLGLLVSGGNTVLFALTAERGLEILAETVDDAAGEALDKGAKLLGMPYPGGPLVERRAEGGDPEAVVFPRGIADSGDMRFSFSGLKTSLRYRLEKMDDAAVEEAMADLCASYQEAVVMQLVQKTRHALEKRPFRSLGLSGGVANNTRLRRAMETLANSHGLPLLAAQRKHTGDNAAMIAFAAWADPDACLKPGTDGALAFDPSWRLG